MILDSQKPLFISELESAKAYWQRLSAAIAQVNSGDRSQLELFDFSKLSLDLDACLNKVLGEHSIYKLQGPFSEKFKSVRLKMMAFHDYFRSQVDLGCSKESFQDHFLYWLELSYKHCASLHKHLNQHLGLDVPVPRSLISQASVEKRTVPHDSEYEFKEIPVMVPSLQKLEHLLSLEVGPLGAVAIKRDEQHHQWLSKAHECLSSKQFAKAHFYLEKAKSLKETAEVLSLAGWCFHQQGQKENAKAECLRAIELDSSFGPSYNDMGSYLLSEGLPQEAIRWFELAKRAENFPNREYSFINAGRAYVMVKQFDQAIDEFQQAFAMAPENEEIPKIVEHLRSKLDDSHQGQESKEAIKGPAIL